MQTILSDSQKRLLRVIFGRGSENASVALSKWLGKPVELEVGAIEQVDLSQAVEAIGPGESLVAACVMALNGRVSGQLLLAFEDRAGLSLADLLQRQPIGTTQSWDELERSAALETANIVGCAYLNALAAHMPDDPNAASDELVPGPPAFLHEFAASLLEFALVDQAARSDLVLLISTRFRAEAETLDWSLVFVPNSEGMSALEHLLGS